MTKYRYHVNKIQMERYVDHNNFCASSTSNLVSTESPTSDVWGYFQKASWKKFALQNLPPVKCCQNNPCYC